MKNFSFVILKLHSDIEVEQQNKVFAKPDSGQRKVNKLFNNKNHNVLTLVFMNTREIMNYNRKGYT
jgi:hypothetical protein